MHRHHRLAITTVVTGIILDIGLGLAYSAVTPGLPWWHGLYVALANAVTLGGDVAPENAAGYAINSLECAIVIPSFWLAAALFTSGLIRMDSR